MRKLLLIPAFLLPIMLIAQTPVSKPINPIQRGEKTENLADTVITKDPTDPSRDYWVIHNMKGTITSQGAMLNGRKEGLWREYNASTGVVSKVEQYRMGRKHGVSMEFSFIGQVTGETFYVNDSLDGRKVTYLPSGKIKTEEFYTRGVLNGPRKAYYEDSKIQEESVYKMGQRQGLTKWYTQAGKPTLEYTYDNGELNGPAKEFDDKGIVKREGNFVKNDEEGEWKIYQDSALVKKVIYKAGQIMKEVPVKK